MLKKYPKVLKFIRPGDKMQIITYNYMPNGSIDDVKVRVPLAEKWYVKTICWIEKRMFFFQNLWMFYSLFFYVDISIFSSLFISKKILFWISTKTKKKLQFANVFTHIEGKTNLNHLKKKIKSHTLKNLSVFIHINNWYNFLYIF